MTLGEVLNVKDYNWMIHEHASKFKVEDGSDGTTVYESTDLTDALGAFDYCAAAGGLIRVKKRTHATNTWYPLSDAVEINGSVKPYTFFEGVAGKMVTNVEVRPTTNTPAFIITGGLLRSSLERLAFTHDQVGYTKNFIQLSDNVKEVMLSGLRFGTTGAGLFKGGGIGFEILTNPSAQYEIIVEDVIARDLENFTNFNLQQVDNPAPNTNFISSIIFNGVFPWNCKRVAIATGVSGAKLLAITFDNIHFQWSASNTLGAGGGVYDFSDALSSWLIRLSNCMTWDIPANVNVVNMGASTELMAINSNTPRIGGPGASKLKSFDYFNHAEGYHEVNAVIGQRDYTISHNLGVIPEQIICTNMSQDVNNQFSVIVPKSSITTTTFVARLLGYPVAGTLNLKFSWRAFY